MKNLSLNLSILVMIAGFHSPLCSAQNPAAADTGITEPSHDAQFHAVLEDGFRYWDKGYLIAYGSNHTLETTPSKAALILYDRDGRVARQPIVWVDGANTVTVNDAAVTESGNLVVSGAAVDSHGAIASFIGQIGSDDRLHNIIRTTPFAPAYVCALEDGTVWTYGVDRDDHLKNVPGSLRLRHYSFEKGQLHALLNITALPDYAANLQGWHFARGLPHEVNLRCNSKEIVLYNVRSGDLVELDSATSTTTITKVPLFPATCPTFCITGFALTESGELFASFIDRTKRGTSLSGLFRLSRGKAGTAQWVAVPGTVGVYLKQSPIQELWGADGDTLVYSRQRDGNLYWSKPVNSPGTP
jgi:hypothetical protein